MGNSILVEVVVKYGVFPGVRVINIGFDKMTQALLKIGYNKSATGNSSFSASGSSIYTLSASSCSSGVRISNSKMSLSSSRIGKYFRVGRAISRSRHKAI